MGPSDRKHLVLAMGLRAGRSAQRRSVDLDPRVDRAVGDVGRGPSRLDRADEFPAPEHESSPRNPGRLRDWCSAGRLGRRLRLPDLCCRANHQRHDRRSSCCSLRRPRYPRHPSLPEASRRSRKRPNRRVDVQTGLEWTDSRCRDRQRMGLESWGRHRRSVTRSNAPADPLGALPSIGRDWTSSPTRRSTRAGNEGDPPGMTATYFQRRYNAPKLST